MTAGDLVRIFSAVPPDTDVPRSDIEALYGRPGPADVFVRMGQSEPSGPIAALLRVESNLIGGGPA